MSRHLTVDIFFDFICPWCLIGKRQLQVALLKLKENNPDVEVILSWHGVQLLPHIAAEGVPFDAFYQQRLGSPEAVRMRQSQVRQAANAVDVDIDFSKIKLISNTAKAHQLLAMAIQFGTATQIDQLLERLFSAYFHLSEDLGNSENLLKIAQSCGFDTDVINNTLGQLNQPFNSANTGSNGVPYFIFNQRLAVAGAHPAETLYNAMLEALVTQG